MSDGEIVFSIFYGICTAIAFLVWCVAVTGLTEDWHNARKRHAAQPHTGTSPVHSAAQDLVMGIACVVFVPVWPVAVAFVIGFWFTGFIKDLTHDLRSAE